MPDPATAQMGEDFPLPRRRESDLQPARAAADVRRECPEGSLGVSNVGMESRISGARHAADVDVRHGAGLLQRVERGGDVAGHGGD